MKKIADILNKKEPQNNKVEADTRMIDALSVMKTEEATFVIVTRDGKYAGIVTERDYAQKVILMGKSSHLTNVEDVMNCDLPTISPCDPVEKCMMLMNAYKTRYLPVFDDFEFKAVITMHDIISISISNKEHEDFWKYSSDKVF